MLRVWFHPVDEPDVYLIVRPDPETSIVCISDGLPIDRAVEAAGLLATVEERDYVRKHIGSPTVVEDPSYSHTWRMTEGKPVWDRSMIPEGLLWKGKVPSGELPETTER